MIKSGQAKTQPQNSSEAHNGSEQGNGTANNAIEYVEDGQHFEIFRVLRVPETANSKSFDIRVCRIKD
jgi:hypothetical protein